LINFIFSTKALSDKSLHQLYINRLSFEHKYYKTRNSFRIAIWHFDAFTLPAQIFDVGAYQGDFANLCIKNFPDSKIAITTWLNERDWVAYDICGLTRRPLDGALWQADFMFVPCNSPLRNDKRWGI
jgi:hypothetical protein